ncbi:MAG: hypothetical protein KDC44_08135, partial [Phaeodactylibacter sp.]|nr:hypothetical protein [Phaeodactylibacter sp.]
MRQYNIEDGLPSTEVHDLYQDKNGYLWLATDHGLCRYDGTQFKVFTNADGLTDNTIFDIVPDAVGRLWFTTYEGGICYFENDHFYPHPRNDSLQQILGRYYVDNLIIDSSGHMLLSVSFSNSFQEPMLQIDTAGRIFREPDLLRLPFRKSRFTSADTRAAVHEYLGRILEGSMIPEQGRSFLQLSNSHYLIAIGPRLFELDASGNYFVDHTYSGTVLTLLEDEDHAIWVGLDAGFGCYYYPEGYLHANGQVVLPDRSISDIMLDREGNYWFSTIEAGVFFMATNALHVLDEKEGSLPQKAMSLHVWLDKLWVGTYEGDLYVVNKEGLIERVFLNVGPIYDMANDRDSFLVTTSRDVFLSDYTELRDILVGSISLRCFEWVDEGQLAMGGMRGFRVISMQDRKIIEGDMAGDFKTTYAMKSNGQGRLWIGALSGLYYLEKDELCSARHLDPLLETRVTDLELLGPDTLLIATKGEGVLILMGDSIRQLDKSDGLSSNFIRDIYIENRTTWWVSSNNGLNRLIFSDDLQDCSIETFTVKSGLPSNEVNEAIEFDGKLWLATSRGACYLDPVKFSINRIAPQIIITQVRINGEAIGERAHLQLGPRENDIAIIFKGLSFRNSTG